MNMEWIDAKQTEYQTHSTYFCDCPDLHRMKLVKPSGVLGKRGFCDYFAHVGKRIKTHDDADPSQTCRSGGESLIHREAKHALREMVGKYLFTTFRCLCCGDEKSVYTDDCSVTIESTSQDGKWRYDCLLWRAGVRVAALEVVHTHITGKRKADAARASGLEIAEFRAADVMDAIGRCKESAGCTNLIDNLQLRVGKCGACLLELGVKWYEKCYADELAELVRQASVLQMYYAHVYKVKAVAVNPVMSKCKQLLRQGLHDGVQIHVKGVGKVSCSDSVEWEHGLLASGFNMDIHTRQICIVILQDGVDPRSLRLRWNYKSIKRKFYFFINCATILQRLSMACEGLCLLDCRPEQQYKRHLEKRQVNRIRTCDSWYDRVFAEP